jgi:hypothetical protein
VKDSENFIKSIQDIILQNYLVSFHVVSLFTNVTIEEVLQVLRNKLTCQDDPSFPERSPLQVEDVMELVDICLTTTYFHLQDKFYQQKEGTEIGNSISVVNNIFMEQFEEIALDTADHKPAKWLKYVDDTFVVLATWAN